MIRYFLTILLAVTCSSSALAKKADFPPRIKAGNEEIVLSGIGTLSRWFIKGCDIALYAGTDLKKSDILGDTPRCLEFYYYRTIKSDQFAVASWDTLRKEWSEERLEAEKGSIDKIHSLYRDVGKGDRYRLIYIPGQGTRLYLNGKELGSVKGSGFAEVYFSIWLGKDPIDTKMRDSMMEGLK